MEDGLCSDGSRHRQAIPVDHRVAVVVQQNVAVDVVVRCVRVIPRIHLGAVAEVIRVRIAADRVERYAFVHVAGRGDRVNEAVIFLASFPCPGAEMKRLIYAALMRLISSSLPFADRIQASFGHHDVSHVRAHTDDAADMYYIDPDECIDCGACVDPCPVDAIFPEDEVPEQWRDFIKINADYFKK